MAEPAPAGFPPDFQFNQGSLQDYVDCPRRFQLRHLLGLAWPAPPAEPLAEFEKNMADGDAFHRLVHQDILGLPRPLLAASIGSDNVALAAWWQAYLEHAPADIAGADRYPEVSLATTAEGFRLIARYDLVAVRPGAGIILDWKTGGHRPRRQALAARLQTRVYRYVLVRAGAGLNHGATLAPEQVCMTYWFAAAPSEPEHFAYDAAQYAADASYLEGLVRQIAARPTADFTKTENERTCAYCCYRSLCERGAGAGPCGELDIDEAAAAGGPAVDLDFEQVAEIAF